MQVIVNGLSDPITNVSEVNVYSDGSTCIKSKPYHWAGQTRQFTYVLSKGKQFQIKDDSE